MSKSITHQIPRAALTLLLMLTMALTASADNFVTDVMVIGGTLSETNALKTQYENQGWTVVNQDLNAGAGGDYIYLLYKTDSDANPDATFITYFNCGSFYNEGGLMFGAVLNQEGIIISPAGHYVPVPYAGGSDFVASQGNLNRGTNGIPLYLYYTKESNGGTENPHIVRSITFNSTSTGAMPVDDFNLGCEGNAPEIYMHPDITQGWVFWQGSDTECIILAYDGPKAWITEYTVPTTHDGLNVIAADVFSGFINLETLIFWENSHVTQMPSMQGCTNFKHVHVRHNYNTVYQDNTPLSITSIPDYAFIGTAIEQLTMPSVTQVGAYAFEGCNLSSVTFNQSNVQIGNRAFANISGNCTVTYSGSVDDWNPTAYVYSPELVVNASDGACGWCGGTYAPDDENYLYWTLDNATGHLNIDRLWPGAPEQQVIQFQNWNKNDVHSLTLNYVYYIWDCEFEYHTNLTTVTIGDGLTSIGWSAFENCSSLKDLYFDGTKAQWNNVFKGSHWNDNVAYNYKEHWRCTVTFNANGHGTAPAPQTNLWSNESKATQPTAPTESGYVFTGWYTDAQCTTPWNFSTDVVPDNMTLYAGWDLEVQGLQGSGTDEDPYLISNNGEWIWFAQSVTNDSTYAGQTVKLAADIAATVMAGSHTGESNYHAFSGTFDGNGHTITLALSGSGEGTALFSDLEGATLKNLKAQGTVTTTDRRPATFAIIVFGNSTISNCWSTVAVSSTRTSGWIDGGGFVGRVSNGATLNMTDCAFHGSVTFTPSATTGGGMVGYTQSNATVNLTNCLYSPSALTLNVNAYNPRVFVSGYVSGNLVNCYYNDVAAASVLENQGTDASGMSNEALAAALGPNWKITDGLVVPKWILTFTKAIADYDTGNGGWYLIASPVGTVNPQNVTNMLIGNYDLYAFEPSPSDSLEWRNYKADTFSLEAGKGYLYAHNDTVTLVFTGAPIAATDSVEVPLVYDSTNDRKCWNLVGNPFDGDATLDRPYYVLSEGGVDINPEPIPAATPIPPCTAVFVKAEADGDTVVFSKVTQ